MAESYDNLMLLISSRSLSTKWVHVATGEGLVRPEAFDHFHQQGVEFLAELA